MSAVLEHTPTHSGPLRVVMAGPLPPAIGGMVTVIEDLRASRLAHETDLVLFDTKKTTPEGRSLLHAISARLSLWSRWWSTVKGPGTVAHIHTCSGLSFFLDGSLLMLARLRGVPVVLHIHGGMFEDFLRSLGAIRAAVARFIARSANQVVVLSEGWRERLTPLLGGARIAVVENGIALPAQAAVRSAEDVPIILFLGNVSVAKGVQDLLDACAKIECPYRLVLVGGDDPAGSSTAFMQQAKRLGIEDRVSFVGPIYGAGKHDYLRNADVFVLPSHAEALPMALLEAMAHGLAVVASGVGAIPSVIETGRSGLLVQARDVPGLATALETLLRDPALRRALGSEARAVAHGRYGVDRAAGELIRLYRSVAA